MSNITKTMDNQKYKDATIEFLGDYLNDMKFMTEDQLMLVWNTMLYGRVGMQVRNYLRNKFPEIDENFKDYGEIEDWSWELIVQILEDIKKAED